MDDLSKDNVADEKPPATRPLRSRFAAWFSRPSLLDQLLAQKDQEIERLENEIEWLKKQLNALTDSFLLSRGNRAVTSPPISSEAPRQLERKLSTQEKLAVEIEVDKLSEMLFYDPKELALRVEDLTKSTRTRDREIARRLEQKLSEMPLETGPNDGVVIG